MTFNGEIYNFKELRRNWRIGGTNSAPFSDTEVIVHAYEEYREKVFSTTSMECSLLGSGNERTIDWCWRETDSGKKPLYYSPQHETFLFASELKAIVVFLPFVKRSTPIVDEVSFLRIHSLSPYNFLTSKSFHPHRILLGKESD